MALSALLSVEGAESTEAPKEYPLTFDKTGTGTTQADLVYLQSFKKDPGVVQSAGASGDLSNGTDYSWTLSDPNDSGKNGLLILKTDPSAGGAVGANQADEFKTTANFVRSGTFATNGILALKRFQFVNGGKEIKEPTKDTEQPTKIASLKITSIPSTKTAGKADDTIFKTFMFGGDSVSLYSGTKVILDGFEKTILAGNVNLNSGAKSRSYNDGKLPTTLEVSNTKNPYSILDITGSLYLNTYNGSNFIAKNPSVFTAQIKGNIYINGYVSVSDKASAIFQSENLLKLNSSLVINTQLAKQIYQDQLGNQSFDPDYKKDKIQNLIIKAKSIEMGGRLDVGSGARGAEIKTDSSGMQIIDALPSDVGAKVEIVADMDTSIGATQSTSSTTERPKDWKDITQAQFLQTSGSSIRIGKNSEVMLKVINKDSSSFGEQNPYAIKLSGVTIESQEANNPINNLLVEAQINNGATSSSPKTSSNEKGAGKIELNGYFEFEANARAEIKAYDGISWANGFNLKLQEGARLGLYNGGYAQDSKNFAGQTQNTLDNTGRLVVDGGRLELWGSDTLNNKTATITLSAPFEQSDKDTSDKLVYRKDRGIFFLGNAGENRFHTINNSSEIVFDGYGYMGTMRNADDTATKRSLQIIAPTSERQGSIIAKGEGNTIETNGDLKISRQAIKLEKKELKGKDDKPLKDKDGKVITQEGHLYLTTHNIREAVNIIFGNKDDKVTQKDRVDISGGTLHLQSYYGGVESYNLRLADVHIDFSKLGFSETPTNQHTTPTGKNTESFMNKGLLSLRGNVEMYGPNKKASFYNGDEGSKDAHMDVYGTNKIGFFEQMEDGSASKFSLINNATLALRSSASLLIGGDLENSGQIVFDSDRFGIGFLGVNGKATFDMSKYQSGDFSGLEPLIKINNTNFYDLSLYTAYAVMHTGAGIQYRVGDKIYSNTQVRSINAQEGRAQKETSYQDQQQLLMKQMDDYLNGKGAYENNDGKLGVFLMGKSFVNDYSVLFMIGRSEAIGQIRIDGSDTGVIDQYLEILKKSEGNISDRLAGDMIQAIRSSNPKAMQVLNNALETQNALELGILKDMGTYQTSNLISVAREIDRSMRATANLIDPVVSDFEKMQVLREMSIQNRMVKASNPFVAEAQIALSVNSTKEKTQDKKEDLRADKGVAKIEQDEIGNVFALDNTDAKNSIWASLLTSTSRSDASTSAIYGFNLGYEMQPQESILVGFYLGYGYSNYKREILQNTAHNLALSAYVRFYYGNSEIDLGADYLQGFNHSDLVNTSITSLSNQFDFASSSFDVSARYGYVFDTPLRGLYVKPIASFHLFGALLPEVEGNGVASIVADAQGFGGLSSSLGAEVRQYVSPFSYIYLYSALGYYFYDESLGAKVSFKRAYNQVSYEALERPNYMFSIYAGGEGFVTKNFSLNANAGYRAGLDKGDHNISLGAGLKYKF
ncbi:hypothetical protein BBW65_01015 [Helicobacter enhydrae]|uniref:Autotransporter domain-containing protein n=2 Tax=Helicobacter enhydrae TaxID=222136 RepID=A0A1B1U3Z1_9HELI|nr:hypothetical protein BBW65_01015 [Helicobacter enhydrae]